MPGQVCQLGAIKRTTSSSTYRQADPMFVDDKTHVEAPRPHSPWGDRLQWESGIQPNRRIDTRKNEGGGERLTLRKYRVQ